MAKLKFGVFLPTFWPHYGQTGTPQAMLEVARAASALGYDSLWACDHIVNAEQHAGSARCLEPLILMAFLANEFPTLHFGTDVLVLPQRSAILVAKQAATLSVLSQGRFILGIGAGWSEAEFRYLGADFKRRGAHTDEAIALMRALWRGTPTSFEGQFYELAEAWFYPDTQGDGPPIWVGGSSPAALRRAASLGDAWMPFWGKWDAFIQDTKKFRGQVQEILATSAGRDVKIAANVPLRIASEEEAFATDTPQLEEQIVSGITPFIDAGLEYVIWNIQSNDLSDYIGQMHLAAERLIPALNRM